MSFMDIMNKSDELKRKRFKISMMLACSFVAVDLLMIAIGYIGLNNGSIPLADSKNMIYLLIIGAIAASTLVCIGVTYSIMKPLHEYEAAAKWIADTSVDSAVKSLKDIGITGLTSGAATVEQLAWNKNELFQPKLHTLTIDQLRDEIIGIGSTVALIEIEIRSLAGEINGKIQICFSKETALSMANELLSIPPEAASREFTENIISTLKEAASIFGDQHISAISEHIRIPILSGVPELKTGNSKQIAEAVTKCAAGKVEYALSTRIAFKENITGLLIVLLEPKSMDTIIQKLN